MHLLIIHVLMYIIKSIALHTNIYLLTFSCSLLFFYVLYITLKSATNGLCNFWGWLLIHFPKKLAWSTVLDRYLRLKMSFDG